MKKEAYYTTRIQNDLVFKYCGYEKCANNFVHNPHIRQEYLVHYLTKGSGSYTCNGVVYKLSQGDIFLIPPQKLVTYQTDQEDPFVFSWFAFTGKKSESIVSLLGFSDEVLVRKLHFQYAINEAIEVLTELINSHIPFDDFSVLEALYGILSKLTDAYRFTDYSASGRTNIIMEHVNKAKSYIKFNYMNQITVKDVSDYVGLERSYFSKIFCKCAGKTAQNYILETRLYHAKKLLETTKYSISEVSSYVGLSDPYYFSRAFHRYNGMSPSEYRKGFHDLSVEKIKGG